MLIKSLESDIEMIDKNKIIDNVLKEAFNRKSVHNEDEGKPTKKDYEVFDDLKDKILKLVKRKENIEKKVIKETGAFYPSIWEIKKINEIEKKIKDYEAQLKKHGWTNDAWQF
jgi:hypothetical protein